MRMPGSYGSPESRMIIHPLKVAITLADLELDLETIEAGLLHDVVEDTKVSAEDIAEDLRQGCVDSGGRRDQAEDAYLYDNR